MKTNCFFLFAFFCFAIANGQYAGKIFWEDDPVLEWEDFRAAPDKEHPFGAITSSGISFSWSLRVTSEGKNTFTSVVKSYFSPGSSWVKPRMKTETLLAHEQLHYDITELHARKLKMEIELYQAGPDIKKDLKRIFDVVREQREQMQEKFDLETRHGLDPVMEEKWQEMVRLGLQKLQGYSS